MVRRQGRPIVGNGEIGEPPHCDAIAIEWPDADIGYRCLLELGWDADVDRDESDFVAHSAITAGKWRRAAVGLDPTTIGQTRLVEDDRRSPQPMYCDHPALGLEDHQFTPNRH